MAIPLRLLALLPLTFATTVGAAEPATVPTMLAFTKDARILFQGDSITNAGRGHNQGNAMGHGYAAIIASTFGFQYPERNLTFFNTGVSGNHLKQLIGRWKIHALDLKPDVISILIGINDRNIPVKYYEEQYDQLLSTTITALPNVKLVICEPFFLPNTDSFRAFQEVAKRMAEKYHAPLVRLQHLFDEEDQRADPRTKGKYWIQDTVHPTYAGHQLIADEWIRTVDAFYGVAKP